MHIRSSSRSRRKRPRPWTLSALEARLMLAADAGAAADVGAENTAETGSAVADAEITSRQSVDRIVFIDADVEESDLLAASVDDAEVVLLGRGQDPIVQISKTLAKRQHVQSVHIVSHGESGKIQLAGTIIDESTVRANAQHVAAWSRALRPDADILIYGCSVGAGSQGQALMATLAEITGADIAASINRSGGVLADADWQLERTIGRIEAGLAFQGTVLASYRHALPLLNYADFQNASGLVTNGDASILGDKLQLTSDAQYQTGSVFYDTPIAVDGNTSFQTAFSFEMTDGYGAGGADGLVFVLQNSAAGPSALGRGGGNLGYDGIRQSLAVKLDTWRNPWDQYNDEVGVVAGGDIRDPIVQVQAPFNLNAGGVYHAWIDYDGSSDTLSVYLSQTSTKPATATLQATVALDANVGDQLYAGFTSSNYNRPNAHRILSWSMDLETPSTDPPDPSFAIVDATVSVNEAAGVAVVQVSRSGDLSGTATIDYQTSDQSATAGLDYTGASNTLTFNPNEASKDILISITDDEETESTETLTLTISNPSGADLGTPSTATITILDNERSLPNYADFDNATGLVTNGGASIAGDKLQVTSAAQYQTGSVFYDTPIAINEDTSFQTTFSFEMTDGFGPGGADGLVFVLQNAAAGASALGRGGANLGYDGIANSLAVKLDTWQNPWDQYNDEVGVVAGGDIRNPITRVQAPFNLNAGGVYHAWIDYDGSSNVLSVYLSQTPTKPTTAALQTTVALDAYVGDQFYAGFTSANYDRPNAHRILSWSMDLETPSVDPPDPSFAIVDSTIFVNESSGFAVVQIARSGDLSATATIDYQTFDQTAIAGQDYTTTIGTATFNPNEATKDILIPIADDEEDESSETLTFTIDNPSGADLGVPRTTTITILDSGALLPNYPDFGNASGIVTNGGASILGDKLQLTSDAQYQTGSAFYDTAIAADENTSFQVAFAFEMADGFGPGGADGLTFVVQNSDDGTLALGGGGGNLGYDGIANSLAVELDTWQNPWDQYNDEIGVVVGGDIRNEIAQSKAPFNLNFGGVYYAWVDYNGSSDTLSVYLSETPTKPTAATLQTTIELDAYVGDQFYAGFTSSNYNRPNAHRILSWTMNLETPIDPPVAGPVTAITVASGFVQPTGIDWSPDGRNLYVAEKGGIVKVIRDGNTIASPLIDISDIVNNVADRGLLDLAVHPDLDNNPYLYLLYTYDPPEVWDHTGNQFAKPDGPGNRAGRLMRVTLDASTNYTTIVEGQEQIILGTASTWDNFNAFTNSVFNFAEPPAGVNPDGSYIQDFVNSDSTTHTVGSLAFGTDGNLFVSIGDGASYNDVDPRAVRVQDIDSLSGKILRIDPISGAGVADNPFYESDNPNSNQSKVYQLGLRNPFRISVDSESGQLFIGDVGWTTWEEVNTGAPGANFGWPYYEGGQGESFITGGGYAALPEAQAFYASGGIVTPASVALSHSADGINAIMLGDVVRNGDLGEQYEGDIFFNDLGQGIVRNASIDANGVVTNVDVFATGAQYVVTMRQGPDGSLYFVDLLDGEIGKWQIL